MAANVRPIKPLKVFNPGPVPERLKGLKSWVVYALYHRPGRPGKTDKRPVDANGVPLKDWNTPAQLLTFEDALARLHDVPNAAGLGLCMRGQINLTGIDLDNVIKDGTVEPWAQEIVHSMGSYTERSPSNKGLRIFVEGETERDWTDHTKGIEVYGGHGKQFLTVTGDRMPDTAPGVNAAPAGMAELVAQHRRAPSTAADARPMPDLVEPPAPEDLDLPPYALAFMVEGNMGADRSKTLQATVRAMVKRYDDATVLSALMDSPFAWEIALDHRRQDEDKAMAYVWKHVCDARAAVGPTQAPLDDFADLGVPDVEAPADVPLEFPVSEAVLKGWFETSYSTAELAATEYLIEGFLAHALMILAGQPGVGKTTALAALMLVVAGFRLGDSPLTTPKRRKVIYVGEDLDQIKGILFAYAKAFDFTDLPDWIVLIEAHRAEVDDFLMLTHNVRRHRHDGEWPWLVLDTAAATLALESENDNSEVSEYMSAIKTKFFSRGVPVAISTHTNKGVSNDNPEVMARGASAFTGDATLTATLLKDDTGHYMRLGKRRYVPEFTQIKLVSHTLTEHVMTRHGSLQRKTLIYVVPEPSSDTEREAAKVDAKQTQEHEHTAKLAATVAGYIADLTALHGEVWMRQGNGGPRPPASAGAKGVSLSWETIYETGRLTKPKHDGALRAAVWGLFEPFEGWGKLVPRTEGALW